jgi:hypothetical protein
MATKKTKSTSKAAKATTISRLPFHKRFAIPIESDEAKRRFVKRISNQVFQNLFGHDIDEKIVKGHVLWGVANDLGEDYDWDRSFEFYVESDFLKCLQVLESSYKALDSAKHKQELSDTILYVLNESETDLGIEWRGGVFLQKGATLLDDVLVNQNLAWLSAQKFLNVYAPFEKGLSHYLRMQKNPKLAYDAITDMYEAFEAFAKIITGRPKHDLSSNAELFLSKVSASEGYKAILKAYIQFANDFRHGLDLKTTRPPLSRREVESFIYLTGLFLRLGMPE